MANYHATQTAKAMLTNTEALDLARRLRDAMQHETCFEQALYQSATPADIECLEALIGTANHLHFEQTSEMEQKTRKYLRDSEQWAEVVFAPV